MAIRRPLGRYVESLRRPRLYRKLELEALEDRYCPAAPAIDFSATILSGRTVELVGTVTDENPQSATVEFSGAVNATVTPAADGGFALEVEADALGEIHAQAVDDEQLYSNIAEAILASDEPSLSLSQQTIDGVLVVDGQVNDEDPESSVVHIVGPSIDASVTPNQDGTFTWSYALGSVAGDVIFQAQDAWELDSSASGVELALASDISLAVTDLGIYAMFDGALASDDVAFRPVQFAGAVTGTAWTDSYGDFWHASFLYYGPGIVDVFTVDASGLPEDMVSVPVGYVDLPPSVDATLTQDGTTVTVSGTVSDEDPSSVWVAVSGVVGGGTYANVDGTFDITAEASDAGTVYIDATDKLAQQASTTTLTVEEANEPPQLTANLSSEGMTLTVSGTVNDETPETVWVSVSGVMGGGTYANADGSYSLTGEASGAGLITVQATDDEQQVSESIELEVAGPPTLQGLTVSYDTGRIVTISGQVDHTEPESVVVTFSGQLTGSTSADIDGFFSYTAEAAGLGVVSVVAEDTETSLFTSAEVTLTSDAPTISASFEHGANRQVIITGQVSDDSSDELLVTISGVVSGSVTTNPDGTFTYTATATSLGSLTLLVEDAWFQLSQEVSLTVANEAPVVLNFAATDTGVDNVWTFSGQVEDEYAAGLFVQLNGLPSLEGTSVEVDVSGWFSFSIQLAQDEEGTVTAVVQDWWSEDSEVVAAFV